MQIERAAATRAHAKHVGQVRLGTGGERGDFIVAE